MKALLAAAMLVLPLAAHAQQQPASPVSPPPATTATPPPAQPSACGAFATAQNAVYAAYIRLIAQELPDPAKVQGPAMKAALEKLYESYVEQAKAGSIDAVRKATALELFGMQIQRQPPADSTQARFCELARAPGREGLLDTLACAVATLDGPRRTREGSKELAARMMEKAQGSVPADANAANSGRVLLDDVSRGLRDCY